LVWITWLAAAGLLVLLSTWLPAAVPWIGVLLGGSLSHAIETSRRGVVCDYICLRFWPAFNLADVAITAGVLGTILTMAAQTACAR
jgi:lipoprotein signal peptidase